MKNDEKCNIITVALFRFITASSVWKFISITDAITLHVEGQTFGTTLESVHAAVFLLLAVQFAHSTHTEVNKENSH